MSRPSYVYDNLNDSEQEEDANKVSDPWEEGSDDFGHSFDASDAAPLVDRGAGVEPNKNNQQPKDTLSKIYQHLLTYAKFVGPGFLISVAYIDPGNYATDVAAGAETRFALLFVIFLSNLMAILFQSLSIKLGCVTGLDLAQNCRAHLPKSLTIILYVFSEIAIIATDISEVIGSAISLNLLFNIPLAVGCAITLADTLFLLAFYRPNGSMTQLRIFEGLVAALVLAVVVCFFVELCFIDASVGDVVRGYLPSKTIIEGNGLYLSCGIIGATVMPHSLFLGSGMVQPRLKEFDMDKGYLKLEDMNDNDDDKEQYRVSIIAIRSCLKYFIIELAVSLLTFATFVNSAILIVAGASLYSNTEAGRADLFGIYELLSQTISPAAGIVFALGLLFSGMSAGVIGTISGQMVSEGMLNWTVAPWLRRLITRSISIVPSVLIAAAVGREGLDSALTASQVVLSVILPVVTAPLIYFTSRDKYMIARGRSDETSDEVAVKMKNHWMITLLSILTWLVLTVMNIAVLIFIALGKA